MDIQGEIRPLTGLRFVAAFWVFLFHMQARWPFTDFAPAREIIAKGAFGMSLFFMLSGFILAYRYANRLDLKDYVVNRVARIYPVYLAAAIVTLPWIGVEISTESFNAFIHSLGRLVLLVGSNIFAIQAWFPEMFKIWNDGGSWSISTEAFFYVMLPALLPALIALRPKALWKVVVGCWLASFLPGVSELFFKSEGTPFYSVPIYRLPEFVIGIAVLLMMRRGMKVPPSYANWGAAALFIFYLALPVPLMHWVGNNWIVVPAIGLSLITLATGKGFVSRFLGSPLMEWLGKISYCFYSFQVLVILFCLSYRDDIGKAVPPLSSNGLLAIIAFFVLIGISAAGYYLIEEPCRKVLRALSRKSILPWNAVTPEYTRGPTY